MVKKLVVKKLKSVGIDSQLSATIRDSAEQIWLAGLGAFAKAQEEGTRVYDALIREGEAIQKKTRKVTEDKVTEMAAKATGTWDELDYLFRERGARYLLIRVDRARKLRLGRDKARFARTFTEEASDLSGFTIFRPRRPGDPRASWPEAPTATAHPAAPDDN